MTASTREIEGDLECIAERVREMSRTSRELTGVSEEGAPGDQESFFAHMESQITAILNLLESCGSLQEEGESTLGPLEDTLAANERAGGGNPRN